MSLTPLLRWFVANALDLIGVVLPLVPRGDQLAEDQPKSGSTEKAEDG